MGVKDAFEPTEGYVGLVFGLAPAWRSPSVNGAKCLLLIFRMSNMCINRHKVES